MKDLEVNKIFASILFVTLIITAIGVTVDHVYKPKQLLKRGFEVEVQAGDQHSNDVKKPEVIDIPLLLASANIESGKVVSKKCVACHSFDKNAGNKVGPNLWGIVGNKKAHLGSAFNYSKAFTEQTGTWGFDELFHFLKKPQKYIPGTKMAFVGISKTEQIADLVLYLNSMSDNPLAIPSVSNTSIDGAETQS